MKNDTFKNLFTFTKSERRGALSLSIAILILLLYNIYSPNINNEDYDFSSFNKEMEALQEGENQLGKQEKDSSKFNNKKPKKKAPKLYNFNPNTTTIKEWVDMGLSPKQARSIVKYVSKGGVFYNKEDLKRMYCLNTKECNRLMPFVVIDDIEEVPLNNKTYKGNNYDTVKVELNSASIDKLLNIRGVGPATANGIIKYKKILGGYVSLQQLKEVYQIDSSKYNQLKGFFTISLDSIKKININTATYFELKKHPYISNSLAYRITQYRNIKGDFKSVKDIKNINTISDSLYQKIYLYFAVLEK